jgi:hypothetical protein
LRQAKRTIEKIKTLFLESSTRRVEVIAFHRDGGLRGGRFRQRGHRFVHQL